jgi:hypothetical protein
MPCGLVLWRRLLFPVPPNGNLTTKSRPPVPKRAQIVKGAPVTRYFSRAPPPKRRRATAPARVRVPKPADPVNHRTAQRLSRYDIAIANRKAGDECEIDGVAEGPALKKPNQQPQHNLKRQYYRQHT